MIYGQMRELQRYQKSRLVYVLPDDLRLDAEIDKFFSVEGCALFLERPTLTLPMCLELFCLKMEICEVQNELETVGTDQQSLMTRLGWLHRERKKVLAFLGIRSNKSRDKIAANLAVQHDWYRSAQEYLESSVNADREEMLNFVRSHLAQLVKYLSVINRIKNVGDCIWQFVE